MLISFFETIATTVTTNWVALVAVMIATVSAIISYKSYRIARKSLDLSTQVFARSQPNSSVYLIDAFRYRSTEQKSDVYVFCISVENRSAIQNSIVEIEMRLPFLRDDVERIAVFSHHPNFGGAKVLNLQNLLSLPVALSVRGALILNCCFEVPAELLKGAEFDVHILRVKFAEGAPVDLQPKLIMDIVDVEALEKKRHTGVPV